MISLSWIDISDKSTIVLQLSGRNIYSSYKDEVRVNPLDLRGKVLLNINSEVVKLRYWLVYENMYNQICIAPVYDAMVEVIIDNYAAFQQPIDIRSAYQMLDL